MKKKYCYMLMILATFFWSGAFIAGKHSTPYLPPFTLTFLRFFIATSVLYIFIKFKGKNLVKLTPRDYPTFLFTGIVGMFGYHVFFFYSLKYTTAVNASIIGATNPIVTTLLASFFLKDKLSLKKILGICISIFGVVLTITGGNLSKITTLTFNTGDILMILAVFMWAAYSVFSKGVCHRYNPLDLTFYSFLFCTIFLIPFVLRESPIEYLRTAPTSAYIAVVYMSIFASFIGYLIQQICIKHLGASSTNIFINLVPVFSMILSVSILKEDVTLIKLLSASIIILGVFVSQKQSLNKSTDHSIES